jgi:ribosomal protein L37AE/L43A
LATEPSPQRAYRAACPNCGAPVEFRSAASAFAVCSFCKSTVVREGDALRKIGESADLFDDHSPLQLGASGKYQGAAFTLVGRLQYKYAEGTWNEWHALFDGGGGAQKSGWLSEDNGRYVIAFDAPLEGGAPAATSLRAGAQVLVAGQAWSVASVSAAKLIAAQGELPHPPNLARGFVVSDLRNARGEVGTLDYSDSSAPRWAIGRSVAISELAMTGLAEAAEKTLKARSVECPSCGTALEIKLSTTQSVVCHQCHAVVDVSQGVGGDLQHYAQSVGAEPLIPLGSTGTLALGGKEALPWQVVGYAERCEVASGDDEQTFWREYLLYHRTQGFAFLVDAQDGWSWAVPITGVPEKFGDSVKYGGALYRKLYDYVGQVTYVLGEFYWQLTKDQRTSNTDYQGTGAASAKRLNREQTGSGRPGDAQQEVVWSGGETLSADVLLKAFKLAPDKSAALQRDALPTSLNAASLLAKIFFWGFILVVVLMLFRCGSGGSTSDCNDARATFGEASAEYQNCLNSSRSGGGYRSGGGSFGGFSSGGGHK